MSMDKKRFWDGMSRRTFLKGTAATASAAAVSGLFGKEFVTTEEALSALPAEAAERKIFYTACPYCGVGCGSSAAVEGNRIIGMIPRKDHPTNKGLQCIKGLTADEPLTVDRITPPDPSKPCLIRKDMSDPFSGKVSQTKGKSCDGPDFRWASWDEALDLAADKIAEVVKKTGPNNIGIWSSGQHYVESLYLENKIMKAVIGSTTVEGSPRMCMTSAVTGYFATQGSDLSPGSYRDVDDADFITHWGHNAREGHPVLFWRIADAKKTRNIPTLVVDPRRTPTVKGYESINKENSYHFPTINGDLAIHNAIAYEILTRHEQVIPYDWLEKNAKGWKEYIQGVKADYNPRGPEARSRRGIDIDPDYLAKVADVWADASMKGRQRGKGGVISFWGIGYNQHLHGQHNTIGLYNLHAITGNVGRPGAAPFSMTGQPNAVGRRMMGGLTARLPFNQGIDNVKHRDSIAELWGVDATRLAATAEQKNPGMGIGLFERGNPARDGKPDQIHCIWLAGGTHVDPADTKTLARPALRRAFVIASELFAHAPNNYFADVILPCTTWGEASGTFVNSERRINICSKLVNPPPGYWPDMDLYIELGKRLCKRLGLDPDKVYNPAVYKKRPDGFYDSEEVFREICRGTALPGSDINISGILEVEKRDGKSPYQQLAEMGGIQWPAPTYEIAKKGGLKWRFNFQEEKYGWEGKSFHYKNFRTPDGLLNVKLVHNDYTKRKEITAEMRKAGTEKGWLFIDHLDVLKAARDNGLTPGIPDSEYLGMRWDKVPKDKFPFWCNTGIVYEHFHTAKTIRAATSRKLVPEQYVEIHPEDAKELGIEDGDLVRLVSPRIDPETGENTWVIGRASVGDGSKVKPARNSIPKGMVFQPWNLSVADSGEPAKNKWLTNAVTHRAFDPVSGQVDYKKDVCRVEKVV